jgi:predicted dehydrogenase
MVRFGIIGTGGVAGGGARDFGENPDAELIAVADPSAERRAAFGERFGVPNVLASAEELLAVDAVDAVYIAVPNYLHVPLAAQALNAGKHVILEKPLALSRADAEPLVEAASGAGKHFMLGMNQRFTPQVQRARQLVEQGRIGRAYHCKTYWRRRAGIPGIGSWFTRKDLSGGGGLLDIGVHMLDNALYILGDFDVHSVSGATYREFGPAGAGEGGYGESERSEAPFDVDDFATAMIKLSGGATVLIDAVWAMHNEHKSEMNIELYGSEGAIDTYGQKLFRQHGSEYHAIEAPDAGPLRYPHTSRFHHFVNVIEGREQPCVSLEQALAVQDVIDAIYASSASGHEVILAETD